MKYRIIEKKGYMAIRSGMAGTGKEVFRVNHWDTELSETEACKSINAAIKRLAVGDDNLIVVSASGHPYYSSEGERLAALELAEYEEEQAMLYPKM